MKGLEMEYFEWYDWVHIDIDSIDLFSVFSGGIKLGSEMPSMSNLIQHICLGMMSDMINKGTTIWPLNFPITVVVGKIVQFSPIRHAHWTSFAPA
jgi:hypothetical protein